MPALPILHPAPGAALRIEGGPVGRRTAAILRRFEGTADARGTCWTFPVAVTRAAAVLAVQTGAPDDALLSPDAVALLARLPRAAHDRVAQRLDELRRGVLPVLVRSASAVEVVVATPEPSVSFDAALRQVRARAVPEARGWAVGRPQLPALLAALDPGAFATAPLTALVQHIATGAAWAAPTTTPTGAPLTPAQQDGLGVLVRDRRPGVLILEPTGTGKTRLAVMGAHLRYPGDAASVLIVSPASYVDGWRDEIVTSLGARELIHTLPTKASPLNRFARWTITSYDVVEAQRETLASRAWDLVILDEAHRLRNDTGWTRALLGAYTGDGATRRWVKGLLDAVPTVWPMTATPLWNGAVSDLPNLLKAIRHPAARRWQAFCERYSHARRSPFGVDYTGLQRADELSDLLERVAVRHAKATLGKRYVDIPVVLAAAARAAHDAAMASARRASAGSGAALAAMAAGKQHAALAHVDTSIGLARDLLAAGEKVFLFSEYHAVLDAAAAALAPFGVLRLDGTTKKAQRRALERRFQTDPTARVFLGQTQACGVALTLTAASHAIANDPPYAPSALDQAEDRIDRLGMSRVATIHRPRARGTFADVLWAMLDEKRGIVDGVASRAARSGLLDTAALDAAAEAATAAAVLQRLGTGTGRHARPAANRTA